MNAIRVIKKIDSDTIKVEGLNRYNGKNAEIIILIDNDKTDLLKNKDRAFAIIDKYSGTIKKWTREELYDRYSIS
jgi:hypothetical protein